jgi:hypothetical protein
LSIIWENSEEQKQKPETLRFSSNPAINDKIKTALQGIRKPSVLKMFLEFATDRDKELVADFINVCVEQENIAVGTKRAYLVALSRLVRHIKKPLEEITAKELSAYFNKMHKDRDTDPDQSWIQTQRSYRAPVFKFYKWHAYPDMTPDERRRYLPREKLPPVLKDSSKTKRYLDR